MDPYERLRRDTREDSVVASRLPRLAEHLLVFCPEDYVHIGDGREILVLMLAVAAVHGRDRDGYNNSHIRRYLSDAGGEDRLATEEEEAEDLYVISETGQALDQSAPVFALTDTPENRERVAAYARLVAEIAAQP